MSLHFFRLDQCFVSLIIANVEKSNISVLISRLRFKSTEPLVPCSNTQSSSVRT